MPYHFHSGAQGSEIVGSAKERQTDQEADPERERERQSVCVCVHYRKGRVAGWMTHVQVHGLMGSLLQGWQDEWMCITRESGNLAETFLFLAFKTEL